MKGFGSFISLCPILERVCSKSGKISGRAERGGEKFILFFFFFQSNILYHFSTVVRRKQETDFLLIMIICPLMNSYFSYPQLFPSSFQKQNCTPITQWVLYNLLWKFLGLHIPLEIIPKKGRLLLPNVSPGHQLLGLLLVSSSGTLLS